MLSSSINAKEIFALCLFIEKVVVSLESRRTQTPLQNTVHIMSRNKRNNDGYQGKVAFWTEQLELAQSGEGRYSLERCKESLAYFTDKAKAFAPMPRPEDAKQRALDACRSKFEGLSESERLMLANKFITDGLGVGIPLNNTMAFLQEAGVISDTELMHSITF